MGDWAKGEFLRAKLVPGKDFLGFRTPGSQGAVLFNSDQFVFFKVAKDKVAPQKALAKAVEDPVFQSAFNVVKGSVPARVDVKDTDFDLVGKQAMKDLAAANKAGLLMGSMAHGHAVPASIKNAIYDVVTKHFNGQMTDEEAAAALVDAINAAK
jgi:glucose/mannose transport system substrate-binding protein